MKTAAPTGRTGRKPRRPRAAAAGADAVAPPTRLVRAQDGVEVLAGWPRVPPGPARPGDCRRSRPAVVAQRADWQRWVVSSWLARTLRSARLKGTAPVDQRKRQAGDCAVRWEQRQARIKDQGRHLPTFPHSHFPTGMRGKVGMWESGNVGMGIRRKASAAAHRPPRPQRTAASGVPDSSPPDPCRQRPRGQLGPGGYEPAATARVPVSRSEPAAPARAICSDPSPPPLSKRT